MIKFLKLTGFIFIIYSLMFAANGGLENALDISTSGVVAQNTKMQVIAQNIANIDTIKDETGNPYKPKVTVMRPVEYFGGGNIQNNILSGVKVVDIKENETAKSVKVYEPGHPEADAQGYVYYPDVNLTKEMMDMTGASSAFEANIVVYNTTKSMMQASLEIGK